MAQAQHTPTPPSLEEAIIVLFCLIDDAYRLLNPHAERYETLKKLSDSEVLTLALLQQLRGVQSERSFLRDACRFFSLVVERGRPLAELREQIAASEVPLERIVVRPNSADSEEDEAELIFAKGSGQEDLLSLMDGLRRVSGVREVSPALANGSADSKTAR